jgi:hypothetical protein
MDELNVLLGNDNPAQQQQGVASSVGALALTPQPQFEFQTPPSSPRRMARVTRLFGTPYRIKRRAIQPPDVEGDDDTDNLRANTRNDVALIAARAATASAGVSALPPQPPPPQRQLGTSGATAGAEAVRTGDGNADSGTGRQGGTGSLNTAECAGIAGQIRDCMDDATSLRDLGPQILRQMENLRRDMHTSMQELRTDVQQLRSDMVRKIDALQAEVKGLQTELSAQRQVTDALTSRMDDVQQQNQLMQRQMQDMQDQHMREIQALREVQFQVLDTAREPLQKQTDAKLVLLPPRGAQLKMDVARRAVQDKAVDHFLGFKSGEILHAEPVARPGTDLLARIEVTFKDPVNKHKTLTRGYREHIANAKRTCGGLGVLLIRDFLLASELREKQQLHEVAMNHLRNATRADKPSYGWRRSRITWWVPAPEGAPAGTNGSWALLSHLDVPPGSTHDEVIRAAGLAEQRARANAAMSATRAQRDREAATLEKGKGKATVANASGKGGTSRTSRSAGAGGSGTRA